MPKDTKSLNLPDALLDYTEGKRVLIVGGQGAREDARMQIQRVFGFVQVTWDPTERGNASYYVRMADLIRGGNYDMVILLVHFSSHGTQIVAKECKKRGVKAIYAPGGYSPQAISFCIQQQMEREAKRA